MPLLCVVIGITPPDEKLADLHVVRGNVAAPSLRWQNGYSMALDYGDVDAGRSDTEGIPTMLLTATIDGEILTPEDVVDDVQDYLLTRNDEEDLSSQSAKVELWASAGAPLPLRPLEGYEPHVAMEKSDLSSEEQLQKSCRAMQEWGLVIHPQIMSPELVEAFRHLVDEAIATTEASIRTHRPSIRIGQDAFQFREIASRNHNRFDLRLDTVVTTSMTSSEPETPPAIALVHLLVKESTTLQSFLHMAMGLDSDPSSGQGEDDVDHDILNASLDFDVSVVYSRPGACAQGWHADGSHLPGAPDAGWDMDEEKSQTSKNAQLATPYAICLFVPLIDLDDDVGYTQFWPGSHAHRQLVGMGPVAQVTQSVWNSNRCRAGDGILYDYRLMHQGMPHSVESNVKIRPVLQIIFKQRWYTEKANYGREPIASMSQQVTG